MICNTENFVPIVVPGFNISTDTRKTGESQFVPPPSSWSSRPSTIVGEMSVREREDAPNSDSSPVPVSELVDDRTGEPVETQANEIPKTQ